jgi:NAD+ dependent glucose-6-phosphate dehydrogenase
VSKRVLVTGGNGVIGRILLDAWRASGKYDATGLTRKPGPYGDVNADITYLEAVTAAFDGIDTVVHMAASSAVGSTWEDVLPSNLVGTYTVFEAARRAGVAQVIFASSNHTVGTNENLYAPALYELDHPLVLTETSELRPDSLYGVSKVYGEAMARYYVDHHGLKAACLRIGTVQDPEAPGHPHNLWKPERDTEDGIEAKRLRIRATWLSERDCVQLIERAIDADLDWFVGYGISNNPRQFWDIQHAREVLGYKPQDAAPADLMPKR